MDLENSWDPIWAAKLGVDVDKLFLSKVPEFMDSALQQALDALKGKYFDFIVMDSLHAVATRREAERDDTMEKEKPVAALAGKLTQFLRVAKPFLEQSQSAMIIIGHARIDVNAGPMTRGTPIQLTGGEHLQHECDLIFQVTRSLSKTRAPWVNDERLGHAMGVYVEKARGPGIHSRFDEIFITNEGFSEAWVTVPKILADNAAAQAVFNQSGHFYNWTKSNGEVVKVQGKTNLINFFHNSREEMSKLRSVWDQYLVGYASRESSEEPPESVSETPKE